MGDGPHRSPPSGPSGASGPAGGQGSASSGSAGASPGDRLDPIRGSRPPGSAGSPGGGLGDAIPGQRALAGAIAMLDHEPAVGLAIVDGQGRPLHANRRFIALTVPAQGPPSPTVEAAPRKGVWARVGAEAVARASAAGRPVVLRFIHDGAQVQLDIWPLPPETRTESGTQAASPPRTLARPAGAPPASAATPSPPTTPADAGEPRFLVLAVEGPCSMDDPPPPSAETERQADGEANDDATAPQATESARPGQAVEAKPQAKPQAQPTQDPAATGPFITMTPSMGELGALSTLTARELEVLALIGQGLATRDIAEALGRSPRTIERHCDAIHKKLHTANRVQMARYAMRAGLTVESSKLKKV